MGIAVAFWVLATITVASALAVVLLRDIFRAALFLVLCFFTIAGIYITLNADFLAAVQILIYAGAVAILLIFAIMLTREVQRGNPAGRLRFPALLVAALMLGTLIFVVVKTDWLAISQVPELMQVPSGEPTTMAIAMALFDWEAGFVLPFEIASVVLLAALIGAIVVLREK